MNDPANVIMLPCGHHNVCQRCFQRWMRERGRSCPLCTEGIESHEVVLESD
eukprot:Skav234742  [mRNA]  locus=scaffold14:360269:360421:- [translate_table: standard]